jgi:hypothetical protein
VVLPNAVEKKEGKKMSNQIKLQQPVTAGSLRATNFFNGRLVTGADLTREQNARREAVRRIGRATGDGVVEGLEVAKEPTAGDEPIVNVRAGLAVNRCGIALHLAQDASVNLLERFGATEQPSNIFGVCQAIQAGTYTAGFGFYLLVLSPSQTVEGSAPTGGLNNAFAACSTDVILETVQFRLLPADSFLKNGMPSDLDDKLLRNYVAYRCFGKAENDKFFANPLVFSLDSYGLLDEMRGQQTLSDNDVPLALIHWTSEGLEFVEMWAVRRRLTKRSDDEDWTQLITDRRTSETEAMMQQFADHLEAIRNAVNDPSAIIADEHFRYLPPAGILPLKTDGVSRKGFDAEIFFGEKGSPNIVSTDGDRLRVMLNQALHHEPCDLQRDEKIQLYHVRENLKAVEDGSNVQKVLAFARHSLPFFGVARFDEATFNEDRFSAPI